MRSGKIQSLDQKDVLLLSLLQENGELSFADLGRHLKLSKMAVHNRIANLRNAGILEGTFWRVNPDKLGLEYVMLTRVICKPKGPEQEKISKAIAKLPGVQSVYQVFGSYDILLIARRTDKSSAKQLIYQISQIPGVSNTITTIANTVIKESLFVDVNGALANNGNKSEKE
jgi:Lrp/AsnC family leucine-responsive transcriptional regulator